MISAKLARLRLQLVPSQMELRKLQQVHSTELREDIAAVSDLISVPANQQVSKFGLNYMAMHEKGLVAANESSWNTC